jgi:transposase-like protein
VTRVWGKNAVIQRCPVHKMRDLKVHVSEKHWPEPVRRLSEPYHETDYATAKASLRPFDGDGRNSRSPTTST